MNLPKGWEYKSIKDVFEIVKEKGVENSTPYLEIGDVDINSKKYLLKAKPAVKGCKISKSGDLLVSRVRPTRGAIVQIKEDTIPVSSAFTILRNTKIFHEAFPFYFFAWNTDFLNFLGENCSGSLYPTVSESILIDFKIPIPPLPEQQAIVAKIEELLSELDNGKQQLLTAQQQLKVYRQSLLKCAFEGKELSPFEDFINTSQNGLSKRTGTTGEEYKVLRLADITNNMIDNSSPRKIVMDENEIEKYKIKNDDLICIRVNGSKDLVGKLVHVSTQNEKDNWAFCDHFIRFRLNPTKAFSKYFHYYFSTVIVRKYIHDNMVTSAGQNTVSQGTIKNVPVPVCSLKEQQHIVDELESKLTVCDKIEETINQSLQQAETLRQSILKKAFEGQLVKV